MKVQLQLSIEHGLKERLKNISKQTGIPVSKVVSNVLESHLAEVEMHHGIQLQLAASTADKEAKK
ncbi:MAG: ribbon-helix-helix domain-containing protein [Chloroflexi bacterium]|nr:ribbon-helix-helix domain-containing protein [Chloroflexota bacterium]